MGIGHAILALSARAALIAGVSVLATCSPIMLEEESQDDRRLYVHDLAANDSLDAQVLRDDGVKFVLQPGKPYRFSITTARTSDVLDVYTVQAGGQKAFKQFTATHDGERQVFRLTSPLASASFFRARLLTGASVPAARDIEDVYLESEVDEQADTMPQIDTMRVKLFFVQKLRKLPTATAKNAFATTFFQQMNSVFNPYGIVVTGVTESVDAGLDTLVFPFTDVFIPIRGQRAPGHASLYLVDSISVVTTDTSLKGSTVLGFSPREVVDISEDRESRVILANRATAGDLAVTAAHELGHFFGLRHTVSSAHDMLQDLDFSNVQDGFSDTRFCRIDVASLSKTAAVMAAAIGDGPGPGEGRRDRPGHRGPFCLRISDNSCSETTCDLENLMHPVGCAFFQLDLSEQQVSFLKRNLAMYRR